MQNLLQNELNQIAEMCGQSRDELEQITKIRRIKNHEERSKEELIIFLLKSKQSIAELINNNLYDNKISNIRRILNRLRDILPKKYRKEIKDKLYEIEHQDNLSEAEKEENDEYLRKLVRILNDKEKYSPYDCELLDYKLHRVCLRGGGSYVKSPEWLANKKATVNPKNKNDNECL